MSLALAKLFELFSPSDYEAFDEEEIGYAGGLCLPEICMALKDAVQTVYQYSVTGGYEKSFDYRGVELFNQRGCLIFLMWSRWSLMKQKRSMQRNFGFWKI